MVETIEIDTERLRLRQWKLGDRPLFAEINSDPMVMEYYPDVLSTKESNDMAEKLESLIRNRGWGFWAVEEINENRFIGFVGLNEPGYEMPFTPCIEIGWRLHRKYWGRGYATEAAKACLEVAFEVLGYSEVVSFTPVQNIKSRAVMERLGMINTNKNYAHPMVPYNSPLHEHVLYEIDKESWLLAAM
jgi:RimJ/RimL family protein N-acetyltransferase